MDFLGYNVRFAMGITDIDDKIIKRAASLGFSDKLSIMKMTRELERDFFADLDTLNVRRPDAVLRVSEHMDEILAYIDGILEKDMAYVGLDGVYFDTQSFGEENYGKLGNSGTREASPGSDNIPSKRHFRDFALWKGADSSPSWDSPWMRGRPGWHIECSAMTHSFFGQDLDIHSGGVDLKFPHHTNEIAQCEAHNSCHSWVSHWIHLGHLYIDGRKMSKSLKNFITIREYLESGMSSEPADDLRIFFLQHKYISSLHFSADRIQQAASFRNKLESFLDRVEILVGRTEIVAKSTHGSKALLNDLANCKAHVKSALLDDINTPLALNLLGDLVGVASQYLARAGDPVEPLFMIRDYVLWLTNLLGLQISNKSSRLVTNLQLEKKGMSTECLDGIVQFRFDVRRQILDSLKDLRTVSKEIKTSLSESQRQSLVQIQNSLKIGLEVCDKARDELAPSQLGIRIDDNKHEPQWRILDERTK